MTTANRQALVVLGMHRSGTSATGGVLHLLGAREPRHLMPPTPANPKGYWESVQLMAFHDRLLADAGSAWDDWAPVRPGWFESSAAATFGAELPGIIEEEFGEAPLLLLKDPRMCRIMPLWKSVLPELDVDPAVVLTVRSASEIVSSLVARDGFDERRAMLLWLRHVLDAEHGTRGMRRTFVRYGSLLTDWRTEVARITGELDIRWPHRPEEAAAEIDDFLDGSLRHHRQEPPTTADPDDQLEAWVAETTRAFHDLTTPDTDPAPALAALDGVRRAFDRSATIFRDAVRDEVVQLRTSVTGARAELRAATSELATVRADHDSATSALATARDDLDREREAGAARADRLAELEQQLFTLRQRTDERIAELAKLTLRMLRAESELERVRGKLRAENGRLRQRLTHKEARVAVLRDEVTAVRQSTSWRVTAPLRVLSRRARDARRLATPPSRKG